MLIGCGLHGDGTQSVHADCMVMASLRSSGEIERAGGLAPLVMMLGSRGAQAHAACALWHMSIVASNKAIILQLGAVPLVVAVLSHGDRKAKPSCLHLMLQLASSSDAKALIVQAR